MRSPKRSAPTSIPSPARAWSTPTSGPSHSRRSSRGSTASASTRCSPSASHGRSDSRACAFSRLANGEMRLRPRRSKRCRAVRRPRFAATFTTRMRGASMACPDTQGCSATPTTCCASASGCLPVRSGETIPARCSRPRSSPRGRFGRTSRKDLRAPSAGTRRPKIHRRARSQLRAALAIPATRARRSGSIPHATS